MVNKINEEKEILHKVKEFEEIKESQGEMQTLYDEEHIIGNLEKGISKDKKGFQDIITKYNRLKMELDKYDDVTIEVNRKNIKVQETMGDLRKLENDLANNEVMIRDRNL